MIYGSKEADQKSPIKDRKVPGTNFSENGIGQMNYDNTVLQQTMQALKEKFR